jgi:diadenosine tetraphosphate (Ap4A) HIT family hydrolase
MFSLHPRLAAGCHHLGSRDHCLILLKNNAAFPWLLVVPQVEAEVEDLHQLDPDQFVAVTQLIREVSTFVSTHFQPTKLNVACIGNIVRQMHIHIVGRSESDPAWPGTVWASEAKTEYDPESVSRIREAARNALLIDTDGGSH